MQRSYFIAVICSLFIHILIVLSLFNYIHTAQPESVGYKNIVQAYVIPEPIMISKQQTYAHRLHLQGAINRRGAINRQGAINRAPTMRQKMVQARNDMRKSGNPEQLLIILHNQIQQQINNSNYDLPESLNKKSAEVRFLLTPTGRISDINIVQSSGVLFLDNLAIQAVKNIEPFGEARKYLITKSYFRVKVYYNSH